MSQVPRTAGAGLFSRSLWNFDGKDPELARLGQLSGEYGMRPVCTPVPPSWPAATLFGVKPMKVKRRELPLYQRNACSPYGHEKRVQLGLIPVARKCRKRC